MEGLKGSTVCSAGFLFKIALNVFELGLYALMVVVQFGC